MPINVNRHILHPILFFFFFLFLYGISHDHIYNYDSLLAGGEAEQAFFSSQKTEITLSWNRFLWRPTTRLFYLTLHGLGLQIRGYQAVQWLNSIVGALGVTLIFIFLSRYTNRVWALLWAGLLAFSHVYWYRSAGGHYHLMATFWLIPLCWQLVTYWKKPNVASVIQIGITSILSIYFHIGNLIIVGVIFLVLFLRRSTRVWKDALILLGLLALLFLPYAIVHHLFEKGGLQNWFLWGSNLARGFSPTQTPKGGFQFELIQNIPTSLRTFLHSFFYLTKGHMILGLKLGLLTTFVLVGILSNRRKKKPLLNLGQEAKGIVIVFSSVLGLYFLFYSLWLPADYSYWMIHVIAFTVLLAFLSFKIQKKHLTFIQKMSLALLVFVVMNQNLTHVILPNRKGDLMKPHIEYSKMIGKLTPPESPVVFSGGHLKLFVPYFSRRTRLSLELYAIGAYKEKKKPTVALSEDINKFVSNCHPVYVTQDFLKAPDLLPGWNITKKDIDNVLKPYTLIPVLKNNEKEDYGLYLLWTNNLSQHTKDHICSRLKQAGLLDQCLILFKERFRENPSEENKKIIKEIEKQLERKA